MHKFDPAKRARLLSDERLKEMAPSEFLRTNGLSSGMSIADIGCGPGFFALPAAEIVGAKGRVYAVDTEPAMLNELRSRKPPENVTLLQSDESRIPIGDGACDLVLLAFVLHEAEDKVTFLRELKRLLQIDGRLLLIDWEKKVEEKGPPFEERIERTEAVCLTERAGFVVEEAGNINPSHYKVVATKSKEV
ncbi:MAG: class I SAM-dependent methyltransferase [Thermodesulfobacteriota bacterium]